MFSQFYQTTSPSLEGLSETQLKELISKHKQDNSSLESEIIKLKSEISNSLNSQNELKSRNLDLEKELRQSRLQHKLKLSQLQKEISSLSCSSPPSERKRSSSATPPPTNQSQAKTTDTQSMTDELPVARQQSMATQSDDSQSVATQFIATQVEITDLQATVENDSTVQNNTNTSAEAVLPRIHVVMMDAFSQTECDDALEEISKKEEEAVDKVKKELKKEMEEEIAKNKEEAVEKVKKEMEEKIAILRNVQKENINNLSVQIQELKAELVSFIF